MSTAVLIPCYKRPEYTRLCLEAVVKAGPYTDTFFYLVDDGSGDGTEELLRKCKVPAQVIVHGESLGLRNTIIEFFEWVLKYDFEYIAKIDNDCLVPEGWLEDLTRIAKSANADIISPNTSETNAAYKYGQVHRKEGDFIPSRIVGGLWFMRRSMIEDIFFEKVGTSGIRAAFHLIYQIVAEKDPKIGWTDKVTYQDVGYWAGSHPQHIKSFEHAMYSSDIGRRIAWRPAKTHDKKEADVSNR